MLLLMLLLLFFFFHVIISKCHRLLSVCLVLKLKSQIRVEQQVHPCLFYLKFSLHPFPGSACCVQSVLLRESVSLGQHSQCSGGSAVSPGEASAPSIPLYQGGRAPGQEWPVHSGWRRTD